MSSLTKIKDGTSVGEIVEVLTAALGAVPESVRYEAFANQVRLAINPEQPSSAKPLLSVAGALAGVVVRWWKGSFWIVRIVLFHDEKYILFNYTIAWAIGLVFLLVGLEGHIWRMWTSESGAILDDLVLWVLLPWTAGVVQVSTSTWSLATTYILHLRTYTARGRTKWPFYMEPRFVNFCGFAIPVLHLAVLLPVAIHADHFYREILVEYRKIVAILASAEADPANAVVELVAVQLAPHVVPLVHSFALLKTWFRASFIVYAIFAGALEAVFLFVAILYLKALRRSLRDFSSTTSTGYEVFVRTIRGLTQISTAFATLMTLLTLNAIWISVLSPESFTNGLIRELSSVLPIYTVILSSLAAAILVLHQTFYISPTYQPPSPSRSPRAPRFVLPFKTDRSSSTASDVSSFPTSFHPGSNVPKSLSKVAKAKVAAKRTSRHDWAFAARDQLPYLGGAGGGGLTFDDHDLGGSTGGRAFEHLEMHPSRTTVGTDERLAPRVGGARAVLTTSSVGPTVGGGIIVERNEVTVVSLPKDQSGSTVSFDDRDDEKGW
ncbi:hypothetical protein JCM10212_004723 [Sporobolomyces blumeae]